MKTDVTSLPGRKYIDPIVTLINKNSEITSPASTFVR